MSSYFKHIQEGIQTTLKGMRLTWQHALDARKRRSEHNIRENNYFAETDGMVTLQYPFETMPIPDNGRYRLHNEMDDCIVCDKCAKICPVDCIEIEPIKATGEVGKASDGSPIRLYAAKFDIDMAKCCYCGLCTTVCPTECLTMTKTFDYSEVDIRHMNYEFGNLTPEQAAEKKALYEQFMAEKEAFKKQNTSQPAEGTPQEAPPVAKPRPAFIPKKQSSTQAEASQPLEETPQEAPPIAKPRPAFIPKKQSSTQAEASQPLEETPQEAPPENKNTDSGAAVPRPKPVFKPTMKPKS